MRGKYDHQKIENKWKEIWEDEELFQNSYKQGNVTPENKKYLLFAFPYPSGEGLHVGHVESKTALDIMARYYRMKGDKVFFPVGWDSFGLPAENYAVKTGVPPAKTTKKAIETFTDQIEKVGISYDWGTEIATSHPGYYKWTQWLFLQLYENNLAYKEHASVNWCPSCHTVLANEQVVDGLCERCDSEVVEKDLEQWFFKITDYKDELIEDLDKVDWPKSTVQHQRNWIGKSPGATIKFEIQNSKFETDELNVFTTRPDTIFGATFMALAPEHPLVEEILNSDSKEVATDKKEEIKKYVNQARRKTEEERMTDKSKEGVFTGLYATNPVNQKSIPVYISDYVLMGYGTGAIMAVPAHDQRDYDFAKENGLDIQAVVTPSKTEDTTNTYTLPYEDEGVNVNSEFLNSLKTKDAKEKIIEYLEENNLGYEDTTYKLRDWLISRQRYWGAPIPIVYDPEGNPHPVKEEHLPWELPTDVEFKPTGESPLKLSEEFKERTERLYGEGWTPEYDTMDTFVDSSWYYLRFTDPRNEEEMAKKENIHKWMPVDFYMIGPEHAVLHLLYCRFITKFLRDQGYLEFDEPVKKMRHQGMILGPDNKKMSKSKGNVINPNKVVKNYGADSLRVYEMFMGPIEADKSWDEGSLQGVYRFLNKVWRLVDKGVTEESSEELERHLHKVIKKVDEDIENLKYNTAIASMMEFCNDWQASSDQRGSSNADESRLVDKSGSHSEEHSDEESSVSADIKNSILSKEDAVKFLKVLAPFAPFITEELYSKLNESADYESIHKTDWPEYKEDLIREESVVIPIQINGKTRGKIEVERSIVESKGEVVSLAKNKVSSHLEGKSIKKEIFVPGKIVNLVVE